MRNSKRSRIGYGLIIVFTLGYLIASAVLALMEGNKEFTFYLGVMLVLVAIVWSVDRAVVFSLGLLACLSLWGAMHMAGGLLPVPEAWPINGDQRVVYSWWVVPFQLEGDRVTYGLKYDHLTHGFGFGVMAWACWQALQTSIRRIMPNSKQPARPTMIRMTLCFTAAMGFGAINEIIEFVATTLGPTNVGGYINTSYDLIANAVGAMLAVLLIALFRPRKVVEEDGTARGDQEERLPRDLGRDRRPPQDARKRAEAVLREKRSGK